MEPKSWQPNYINIEKEFSAFVPTFRDGKIVREIIPDSPSMALNADFFFPEDGVIVELKTMQTDSRDGYSERLGKAYTHFGYTGSDIMGYLFRGDPMPSEVSARLRSQVANPLRQAMRKANKQIADTKRHLGLRDAFGLAIFANDRNYGLKPAEILSILCDASLKLSECHVDGFVFTTPNVYYDSGEDVAQTVWLPLYAEGRETLADFVNPLGSAWFDYVEKLGDPYLDRRQQDEFDPDLLISRPIQRFRR